MRFRIFGGFCVLLVLAQFAVGFFSTDKLDTLGEAIGPGIGGALLLVIGGMFLLGERKP